MHELRDAVAKPRATPNPALALRLQLSKVALNHRFPLAFPAAMDRHPRGHVRTAFRQ